MISVSFKKIYIQIVRHGRKVVFVVQKLSRGGKSGKLNCFNDNRGFIAFRLSQKIQALRSEAVLRKRSRVLQ